MYTGERGIRLETADMPEIFDLYNKVTGENKQIPSQQQVGADSVAEEFKRVLKRINEARKFGFYDKYK